MFEEEMGIMKKTLQQVKEESQSLAFEMLSFFKKIIILLIVFIFLNNIGWFVYTSQLQYTDEYDTMTQEQIETNNSSMNGEIN